MQQVRSYTAQKAALTRATRSGDRRKILAECRRTLDEFERSGFWPDDWSRWERAKQDAEMSLRRDGVCLMS